MRFATHLPHLGIACLALLSSPGSWAAEEIINDSEGMPCHLYTPDNIDPNATYQLVVGVHGAGGQGKGAGGLKGWSDRGDVIVIGPSFRTKGERPYQNGDGIHAEKLIQLFRELGKKFKLRDKMFLHGFSGGSQFVHRFTMLHPDQVCGVSAHSGGSWATDGFGTFNPKAKSIPFAISCGEKDTARAWGDAPYNRLEWFHRFQEEIKDHRFCHIAKTWPEAGHHPSAGVFDLAKQCFQIATGLPGESATESVEISADWQNLGKSPAPLKPSTLSMPSLPQHNPNEMARAAKAAFAIADKETVTDEKLMIFMEKHPPVLWKNMEGSQRLLEQCRAAAIRWKEQASKTGQWDGKFKARFEAFSQGLDLPSSP